MSSATANFGWLKPDIGASNDQWGSLLNNDLDAIDSQVKANQTAIPAASASTPVMDGTAAVGTGTTWARADHVHPSDTSRVAKAGDTMTGALNVAPASGTASMTITGTAAANANIIMQKGQSGQNNQISCRTGANLRWLIIPGDSTTETGSGNTGSNFIIACYADNGSTQVASPLIITRSTGVCTFSAAIVNGPSDRRLKENIAPLEGALDKVLALQGVSFNLIATPDKPEIGLIAQDVEPVVPEVIQVYNAAVGDPEGTPRQTEPMMALDYPKLTALLIEAVKTLTARVEALEAAGA